MDFNVLVEQLEAFLVEMSDELSRIKGWSYSTIRDVLGILITGIPMAVPLWMAASPEDRRKAFITAVNKHINVPWVPEAIEGLAIGWMYDAIAKRILIGL